MKTESRLHPVDILLVEDDEGDVRLTREVLKDSRVRNNLFVANTGEDALARLRKQGKYAGADLQRWTRRYNVDFARNPHSKSFDFAELDRGALVAIEDGRGAEYVTAVFAAIWGKPEDLSQRSVLIDVLERADFDAQRLLDRASTGPMIAQLEAETKAAAERGVFGAPTMFVGDEMYFGNDRFDFVVEALRSTA